jgi:trimeric autotransporter adhesin
MKTCVALKTVLCGLAFLSVCAGGRVMAADKVVVIPMGSGKIYTVDTGNLFVGDNVGNHTLTGTYNTGTGKYALYNITSGSDNTANGANTLRFITKGTGNTSTGNSALYSNTTGNYNTATGGAALFYSTTGSYNTAIGGDALAHNSTGTFNTANGSEAGNKNTTGDYNTFIGAYADTASDNLTNATAIGYGAIVNASNKVRIGNDNVTKIEGKVAMTTSSDKRLKKDIREITRGLEFIKALRPVEYRMIQKEGEDRLNFGFIAQDIEALLGEKYNILSIGNAPDRSLSLRYTDFIAPMVKAMQEQQGIIEGQQKSIEEMKQKSAQQDTIIVALRSELDALKMDITAMKSNR